MAVRVFNTLSRSVETFVPLDPEGRRVSMYCCGPTVHDLAHIGNFRTFVFVDLFRRFLEFSGFEVRHVMNITDVEDKIIRKVQESGEGLKAFTEAREAAFFDDLKALNCLMAHDIPRATGHIGAIIGLIKKLEQRGIAYQASDGSVYFGIERYRELGHRYGQLLKLNLDEMRPGERVQSDEYEKDAVSDFALWKARTDEDGEVFWKSPWGEGRPGWHIECSAMSTKLLGNAFDLHLGGEDLIFPHHEDEIAQTEGAGVVPDGQRFVRYWMHGAHLLVEGKKMSKSLGNFFTVRDLLDKGFTGREIRYLLLTAHYREPFNFTLEGLRGVRSALGRIDECVSKLSEIGDDGDANADAKLIDRVQGHLSEDLNVSAAWGAVFDWVRECNRGLNNSPTPEWACRQLAAWKRLEGLFGIEAVITVDVPPEVEALMERRQAARRDKDFAEADRLRDELQSQGWAVEDTPKGPRLKRLAGVPGS